MPSSSAAARRRRHRRHRHRHRRRACSCVGTAPAESGGGIRRHEVQITIGFISPENIRRLILHKSK